MTQPKKNNVRRDSAWMKKIGARGGARLKKLRGPEWFSQIAALSHKKNNKKAKRTTYKGGRPGNAD